MNFLSRHLSLICLLAVPFLIASPAVRGESPEAAKRAFAERLARRARAERAQERKASIDLSRHKLHNATTVTNNAMGVPAASPFTPPTGYGSGRDNFVNVCYEQILGRPATHSEVSYWDRFLVLGVAPRTVADRIWASMEHKMELQNGTAPGVPLNLAYKRALAFGRSQQFGPNP